MRYTEFNLGAYAHHGGALTLIAVINYAIHTCRRVDPRHVRNLLLRLKTENPKTYEQFLRNFN